MRARLYIRVRLSDGRHRYLDPVPTANHKIKQSYALVNGKPEHCPKGVYYLRYLRDGKRVWEAVGTDAATATIALKKKNVVLCAEEVDVEVVASESEPEASGRPVAEASAEYLTEVKAAKSRKTWLAYGLTLRGFVAICENQTLERLSRSDVLAYTGTLRECGVTPRTIANRLSYLKTFFKRFDLQWPMLKTDRVKYTEKNVEAYSSEELSALFSAADPEETDIFQFFLCTGVREQEATYATWKDVDFNRHTFKVSEKLDLGFTPKDKEEGVIPVPDALIALLQARRKRYPTTRLIFPGPSGKANGHFLRDLQALAYRAGLNCGGCYNKAGKCCSQNPMCQHWGLHRFRKTFATMHHEAGVPVRTIQRWLRHSSLETTLRYLAGSDDRSEKTRAKVNATFAGLTSASLSPAA
jgi:integrase